MDNLSHSAASIAAGELLHRFLPRELQEEAQCMRHRLLLLSCTLAGNFPDLDLLLTPLLPAPLGYLLHHRGHTHTLLYALPQALLLATLILAFWPRARMLLKASGTARTGFVLAILTGFTLHLAMDYLNSYGLHPFHPFDSRWYYGDMVFILEPVFWVAFGVPMALLLPRTAKIPVILLLLGIPLYFTIGGFLSWATFAALCLLATLLIGVHRCFGAHRPHGLLAAFLVALSFIAMQRAASGYARASVEQTLPTPLASARIVDVAMTAFPGNPFCWNFVSIEQDDTAGLYRLVRGTVSANAALLPVTACPASLMENGRPVAAGMMLHAEASGSLHQLRELQKTNCHFTAWLRFARAPMVDGSSASDLRYASSPRGNFTTMDLERFAGSACPQRVPQWEFPRADLLALPTRLPADTAGLQ